MNRREFSVETEAIKNSKMKMLEIKKNISQIKNSFDRLIFTYSRGKKK